MAFNRTYNQSKVDVNHVGKDIEPLPVGEYTVQVTRATDKISQAGNDMIELELSVIAPIDFKNYKLWVYIVDNEYADQKVYEIFRSCGKPVPAQIARAAFIDLVGRVKTKRRRYDGEIKAEVNYWIPAEEGELPPAPTAPTENPVPDDIPF